MDSILSDPRPVRTFRILPWRRGRIALEPPVAALLAEPPGRIALDDEQLRSPPGRGSGSRPACRASDATSSALLRRVSSPRLARSPRARRRPRPLSGPASWPRPDAPPATGRGLPLTTLSTAGRTSEETSLSLVWLGELRVRHLDRQDAGQPLARVVAAERPLLLLGEGAFGRIGVDLPGQRAAKAGEMGAPVALRDVVGEAEHRLVIGVGSLHGDLDHDALALGRQGDRRLVQRLLRPVEIVDEWPKARPRSATGPFFGSTPRSS